METSQQNDVLAVIDGDLANNAKRDERERLAALIVRRPSKVDLKLRNIMRFDISEATSDTNSNSLSISDRSSALKSCLKKRPERTELVEKNILKHEVDGMDSSLAAASAHLRRAQISDSLNDRLAIRPNPEELPSRIIKFEETVEVLPTFRRTEYNRRPDLNATFRKLTPRLKMEIRAELNNFKKTEMPVHDESQSNTAFH